MEDLAASIMSLSTSHSAPLYLFYSVRAFPKHHGEALSDVDDDGFEFAAAPTKNADAAPRACSSDVSAFADELFRSGVLLPLKLPPRLQRPAWSAASSAATSPTALDRLPSWSPFASKRHTGFDPFAAALQKVRRDGAAPPRRARWLSPLRGAAAGRSGSRAASTAASEQKAGARMAWRRRGGVKHFFCRAVMASSSSSAAPRALRPRRRSLLVCFGF